MTEIPSQIFVGDKFPPNVYKDIESWQDSPGRAEQIAAVIGEEVPMPEALRERLSDVLDATKQYYADRLGIDVSSRMPTIQNLHLLTPENFMELRQKLNLSEHDLEIFGFPLAEKDMALREVDDEALSTYVVQHEVGHILGANITRVSDAGNGGVNIHKVRGGLSSRHLFHALEEYTVEETTRGIVTNYWPRFDSLKDVHPTLIAHEPSLKLGHAIIDSLGYDANTVLSQLQRAHLTGIRPSSKVYRTKCMSVGAVKR
jgi:hypothetical protein